MTAATANRSDPEAGHVRPEDFRHRAACRGVDPELFFPVAERGREHDEQVAAAKAVCASCPVRAECLAWALRSLSCGVAGGMTERERRGVRSEARQARHRARAEGSRGGNRAPLQISTAQPWQGHEHWKKGESR
jgi:hypothetical protein